MFRNLSFNLFTVMTTSAVLCAMLLVVFSTTPTTALPIDEVDEDNVLGEDKRPNFLIAKFLSAMNRLQAQRMSQGLGSSFSYPDFLQSEMQQQKRGRMQSRSGGMSLCLWKVCPAAPWLISK